MNFSLDYFDIINTVKYNLDIPNMFVGYMRVLAKEDMQVEDLLHWDLCHLVIFWGEGASDSRGLCRFFFFQIVQIWPQM